MRYSLYFGLCLGVVSTLSAQVDTSPRPVAFPSEGREISLTEAIRLARENSPQTVQARGTERANKAAVRSAFGAFLPSISLSTGASRRFGVREVIDTLGRGSRVWTYNNGFSFGMDLFNGRRFADIRAAKADVSAAEATIVSQDYSVSLNVAQQYYNALAARESAEAAVVQLEQANQQLVAATRRMQAGAATRSDSLRAFVQVANARSALLTAQTNLRSANAALTRLIASPDVVTARTADSDEPIVLSPAVDSAYLVALAMRGPAVVQARAALSSADARQTAARAAYLPTLSANYSRSGNGADSRFGFGSNPYTYGGQLSFSLNYPLFNQFSREEQVVRAKVSRVTAEATLRDAELAAQQLSVQLLDALHTAQENINAQAAAVEAAQEDLRVQQARYVIGMSTIVDLLTSQSQLNQAQSNLIAARYNARIARVNIESLIGQDFDTIQTPSTPTTQGAPR